MDLELAKLMGELVSADADRKDADREYLVIEQECIRFMEQNEQGSTEQAAGVTLKLTKIQDYNKSLDGPLRPLMELLDPEKIESLLTPVKPPPPRLFNITKVKAEADKQGSVFKSALEAAKTGTVSKLKINYLN